MDDLIQDVRYAARGLAHDVGFAAMVLTVLALGVGVHTAVFSVVRSTLLDPLPYDDPGRLTTLWTTIPDEGVDQSPSSYANVQDWKDQTRAFEDIATFDPVSLTLAGGPWPEQVSAARVSANLFSLLGVAPEIGRSFSSEEWRQRSRVVVLGHGLWQSRFGGLPDVAGREIEIAGQRFEIVGVMPRTFGFPDRSTSIWLPETVLTDWDAVTTDRGTGSWRVVARLREGTPIQQARDELARVMEGLRQSHPGENAGLGADVVSLRDQVTGGSYRLALWALFGAVSLVLLIACINAAHLFLVRGMDRARDVAVRMALGATASRMVRQTVIEGAVLSIGAATAGMLLAWGGVRLFVSVAPANTPRVEDVGLDAAVFLYAALIALAAGALSSVLPVLGALRTGLHDGLREGRGPSERTRGHRVRQALIGLQFAVAIVLVFGANLLVRSLVEARGVDPGFQPGNVLMANLSVESAADRVPFYEQVVRQLGMIQGVRSVGIVEELFISGAPSRGVEVDGRPGVPQFAEMRIDAVGGDFFEAAGAPIVAGRAFPPGDAFGAQPVAVINETMARRFWPGQEAVGKRFRTGDDNGPWIEVVGVVGDMRRQGPEREPIPQAFRPYAQAPSRNMVLLLRADRIEPALVDAVRTRVAEIDGTVPVYRITTLPQALDRYYASRRYQTFLLALFSLVALILAAGGIYGIIQQSVARRTPEIGVRMALGAVSARIMFMILRQGLAIALPGVAVGIVCALWVADVLSGLLFGVGARDVATIAVTTVVLLLTAAAASYVPARRAARVSPMAALQGR